MNALPARAPVTVERRLVAGDLLTAVRIAVVLLALAGLTALAVRLAAAGPARDLLGFGFAGTPARLGEAVGIFLNNVRLLAAVVLAAFVAQLARSEGPARGAAIRAVLWLCDAVLIAAAAGHAVLVGSGVGAYGERLVLGLLPHGPVELAAFAMGLALYVAARREQVSPRRFAVLAAAGFVGLAIAAPMEVFLVP